MFNTAKSSFDGKFVNLRLVEESDAEFIINIRSAPTKAGFLSAIESSVDNQKNWIKEYKKRENAGSEFYYIITTKDDQPCGTVRLYDIVNQCGCFGSLILGENKPRKAALESTMAVFSLAFNILLLTHCEIKTAKTNTHTLSFITRFGAQPYGEDLNEIFLIYKKETFCDRFEEYKSAIRNAITGSSDHALI